VHPQAFHTCSRHGLAGQPGFQYNAASATLTRNALDQLAATLVGYQAPRDAPPQPTPEEMSRFPVSFRYREVEGVGPAISRTVYVGREFRGGAGEPDTGRYGNYFSHLLLGEDGEEPFDGLLPIELWEAEHWTTRESRDPELPPIGPLRAGPLDVDGVLETLLAPRSARVAEVLDASIAALEGGPRVVLVEEPGPYAAAWVALVSFALPRALSSRLTFSTFEGRPRYVDLQLTLTTAACDVAFPSYELGDRVTLIDLTEPAPPDTHPSLAGRAVAALARTGGDALAGAAHALSAGEDTEPALFGAALAVISDQVELVQSDADLLAVLELLTCWQRAGRDLGSLPAAAASLAESSIPATPETLIAWAELHASARAGEGPEAEEIVDAALEHILSNLDLLDPLRTSVELSTVEPSVIRLAQFVDGLESAAGPKELAARVAAGWQLGLVGFNDEVDTRFAAALAGTIEDELARHVLTAIRSHRTHGELLQATIEALLERALNDPAALGTLEALAEDPLVRETVADATYRSDSFEACYVGVRLQTRHDTAPAEAFLARLATLARTDLQQESLRQLIVASGLPKVEQHVALLSAYAAASRRPPQRDMASAWEALLRAPFDDRRARRKMTSLIKALLSADPDAQSHAGYIAWRAVGDAHAARGSVDEWVDSLLWAARRGPSAELPDERYREVIELSARLVLSTHEPTVHRECFEKAARSVGISRWLDVIENQLAGRGRSEVQDLADLFVIWTAAPKHDASRREVLDRLLPNALERRSAKAREALTDTLPPKYQLAWLSWCEHHQPAGAVARGVGRLRRRNDST
jgi:GTPase-associated protein 1, N-terminal domain type 2/GTPase-associated protein 1, middle domain